MRRSGTILPAGLLVAWCAACAGGARPPALAPARAAAGAPGPRAPAVPRAGLRLVVAPADAEVEIDGVHRGPASALAAKTGGVVALPAGVHRVSIRRDGYQTWRAEVAVEAAVERIEIRLVEGR